jgi:Tol biopolymer transport system component
MSAPRMSHIASAVLLCLACNGTGAGDPAGPSGPTQPPAEPIPVPTSLAGMMAVIMPGGDLAALDLANGSTVRLGPSGYFQHVSPDGRKLIYTTRGQVPALAIWDLATRRGTAFDMPGRNVAPRWSHDGANILFWSDRTGRAQLWIMDADGGNQRQLTATADGENLEGDWAPDGATIAFRRCLGSGPGSCNIWLVDADGTNMRQLTVAERHDQNPRWSPDGRRIAFVRFTGFGDAASWDIWVMDADGSNMLRVTAHRDDDWAAVWSPDGERLAFFRHDNADQRSAIYSVRPDGTQLELLLSGPEQPVYGPAR